jgi:tRNA A-37 threonylcarbamoyl transferase component Bud32
MRVIGPFEIGEPLARGGHAVVHAARPSGGDPATLPLVAKVAVAGGEVGLHYENTVLRRIDHPHVVVPAAFVDDSTHAALLLPRAVCSLRAHAGHVDEAQAVGIVRAIAGALAAVHRAGYAHNDVTAGNVLLYEGSAAVLADFGSAISCTAAAALEDVAALAREVRSVLAPGESTLRALLDEVERAPCDATELAQRVDALGVTPRPIDVHAAPPVALEPPTIVVDPAA